MDKWIKLSLPKCTGNEQKYIDEALREDWIVPLGPAVDEFEHRLEDYLDHSDVVALSAGTAALHLGLVMLGVGRDDEVICQSLTFSASCNPVAYQGARPVFVGSEPDTWNMSPGHLARAIEDRIKVTGKRPSAIVTVDLYGMPAKYDEILAIADRYGIPVLEDAAEALGSEYRGKKCGTIGRYGALSFNGNKVITTSGGGALICPGAEEAARVKFLSTQARENRPYYYHEVIGYNYRLSNISAAIGCGQIEDLNARVARRQAIHDRYADGLKSLPLKVHSNPSTAFRSNYWLTTILLASDARMSPDELRIALADRHIETRLLWRPMHMQPVFEGSPYYGDHTEDRLFERGLCLPSGSSLSDDEIDLVITTLRELLS